MRSRIPPLRIAVLGSLAAAFTLLSPCATRAQSSSQSAREAQAAREARRIDMEMRQRALRHAERLKDAPRASVVDTGPTYEEVAENFEQLQLRNYSLARAAAAGPIDYAAVKKEAAEVRKRASRLKGYLMLPKPDDDARPEAKEQPSTPDGLKQAVASLDALVNAFVHNPVFQRPGVIDLEQSSKASRDLAGIIDLSDRVRRCAEGLAESAAKAKK